MPKPDPEPVFNANLEALVAQQFLRLADLSGDAGSLALRGRFLSTECLAGTFDNPLHLTIRAGRVAAVNTQPGLMRSWCFAYRATAEAWAEYWRPIPRPGWHDLLALTKLGAAKLEGDLHPFLSNLQFFKDLLALPRGHFAGSEP